jgi:hypothetical protein
VVAVLKDERLAAVAREANVARFASFGPGDVPLRHVVLGDGGAGRDGGGGGDSAVCDLVSAVTALHRRARSLNVRTFRDDDSKGTPFRYGLSSVEEVVRTVRELAAAGFYTIVNETVEIGDGGVSGVLLGGVAEFAPGATPRAVEQADAAALPAGVAIDLLRTVYGPVDLAPDPARRIEFSVHPGPVGYRRTATLIWEVTDVDPVTLTATPSWPNAFSRHIGDKAYGLLLAHLVGLPVPRTTVLARTVAPFGFGRRTGPEAVDRWIRTCPTEPQPGLFTSARGWLDPYALLAEEDPTGTRIASVLDQDGVDADWAGATALRADGSVLVEGVRGTGDAFMLGDRAPEAVPASVADDVRALVGAAAGTLGPVRIEWAHDGTRAWLLQLHRVAQRVSDAMLSPGAADRWLAYDPRDGLDRLRELVAEAQGVGAGVEVTGGVGVTSHVGDILRKAGVPGRRRGTS